MYITESNGPSAVTCGTQSFAVAQSFTELLILNNVNRKIVILLTVAISEKRNERVKVKN